MVGLEWVWKGAQSLWFLPFSSRMVLCPMEMNFIGWKGLLVRIEIRSCLGVFAGRNSSLLGLDSRGKMLQAPWIVGPCPGHTLKIETVWGLQTCGPTCISYTHAQWNKVCAHCITTSTHEHSDIKILIWHIFTHAWAHTIYDDRKLVVN